MNEHFKLASPRRFFTENEIHRLIFKLFRQGKNVVEGPGDDCAVLDFGLDRYFLLSADQLVSGIHYDEKSTSASAAAGKLLNRNVSDIAAMGGMPSYALLSIAAKHPGKRWMTSFLRSLENKARKYGISVCGGDVSSNAAGGTVCSLTIAGWVEKKKLCLRSSAAPGDFLYATGEFGNSFHSGHHLKFTPRLKEARFLAGTYAGAMIDVSDGILADARRMAEMSKCGLTLLPSSVPLRKGADLRAALAEGEDYELVFAVNPRKAAALERNWPFAGVKLSRIGKFTKKNPGKIADEKGKNLIRLYGTGYEHFGLNGISQQK